jgi:hypothetical protein
MARERLVKALKIKAFQEEEPVKRGKPALNQGGFLNSRDL